MVRTVQHSSFKIILAARRCADTKAYIYVCKLSAVEVFALFLFSFLIMATVSMQHIFIHH